jgi:hypothetical protein
MVADMAALAPPAFDAAGYDGGTWVWLDYLRAPVSGDVNELRRSLLATAELYDWAPGRWAERTGRSNPRSVLATVVLARLRQRH